MAKTKLWSADGDSAEVRFAFVDRTTAEGMTAASIRQLQAAAVAAKAAGLSQITVIAAKGAGHKSHFAGTEWDIQGFNANGSMWSRDQRVMVAEGTKRAGANRFGLYSSGRTLHFGNGPAGFAENITWGAGGLTSGDASRRFTNPAEKAFAASVAQGTPFLAYDELVETQVTVPAQRAIQVQLASAKFVMPDLPKGLYGEEAVVQAAISGNPAALKTAFETVSRNATGAVLSGFNPFGAGGPSADEARTAVQGYFTDLAEQHPEVAREIKTVLTEKPEMWTAVPADAQEAFQKGFDSLPEIPMAVALGAVPMPRLRPPREQVGVPIEETAPPQIVVQAAARELSLGNVRDRVLNDRGAIRKGAKSEAVREVQRFLNASGVKDRKGRSLRVDGDMGVRTKQAVISYQRSKGLKPDGVIGPRTFRAMAFDTMPNPRLRPNGTISREAFQARFDPNNPTGNSRSLVAALGPDGYVKERDGNPVFTEITRIAYGPESAGKTREQKSTDLWETSKAWDRISSPAFGAASARGLQGYVPTGGVAKPVPSASLPHDPFNTRVAGKDESRMPAYVTEDDMLAADLMPVPADPGYAEVRNSGGGMLGGIMETFDSIANSSRAFAERSRAAERRDREAAARSSGGGSSSISMNAFSGRFSPEAAAAAAAVPYQSGSGSSGYVSPYGKVQSNAPGPNKPSSSAPGGYRPSTPTSVGGSKPSVSTGNGTKTSTTSGGSKPSTSSGPIKSTNSTSGPGRTERLGGGV